ncbi:Protein CBG26296 [Caenorhabditis briggsae]|uniref:Protein CBG26296 n=1 Tax=Caenorhabditis briggsae TaxID=6238 RepID=B6IG69_CAEBR|nr:Protein CBG26296 [Caenorhabditis briggsae]CAR98899.1 Protein CBG26296 [Caenorhabditis briggsae]
MDSEDDEWHTSYAMSSVPKKMFFVIIDKGISAMLENDRNVKLGSFYEVKYAFNGKATPENRAQHVITQYRPIKPLAQSHVDTDDRGLQHVIFSVFFFLQITTSAEYVGLVNAGNKRVAKLYNDTFGNFIDLFDLCTSSKADKFRSIFVPRRILAYHDLPEKIPDIRRIIGFVCSAPQRDGSTFVWSKYLVKNAYLDIQYCRPNENVVGCWVDASVDVSSNRVVEVVDVIRDVFDSRVCQGVPEVRASFTYHGFDDRKGCRVYYHDDFRHIFDYNHKVKYNPDAGWYRGWISNPDPESSDFWIVSSQQDVVFAEDLIRELSPEPISRNTTGLPYRPAGSVNEEIPIPGSPTSFRPVDRSIDARRETPRASFRAQTSSDSDGESLAPRELTNSSLADDVAPGRRRITATRSNNILLSSDCDSDYNLERRVSSSNHAQKKESFDAPVDGADRSSNTVDASIKDNFESLRQKNSRICALVKSFTKDESVSFSMQVWSNEDYEELLSLVNSNDE